jgi:hypothetical protein
MLFWCLWCANLQVTLLNGSEMAHPQPFGDDPNTSSEIKQHAMLSGPLEIPQERRWTAPVTSGERSSVSMPVTITVCFLLLSVAGVHTAKCFNPSVDTAPAQQLVSLPAVQGFLGLYGVIVGVTFATRKKL